MEISSNIGIELSWLKFLFTEVKTKPYNMYFNKASWKKKVDLWESLITDSTDGDFFLIYVIDWSPN